MCDFVLANEAQESCVLLSALASDARHPLVEVALPRGRPSTGARLRIFGGGRLVHATELGSLQGRGSQSPATAHVGLPAGEYRVEVRYSSGKELRQEFTVGATAVKVDLVEGK